MVRYETIIRVMKEETLKCQTTGKNLHKGIRENFKRFYEKYGQLEHEELDMMDEHGNILYHKVGKLTGVDPEYEDSLKEEYYGRTHALHNHPEGMATIPPGLSDGDVSQLLMRNDNGSIHPYWTTNETSDYIVRSITATSPNGGRMTLIRGNEFPGKWFGHEDAARTLTLIPTYYRGYYDRFIGNYKLQARNELRNYPKSEWQGLIESPDFHEKISKKTIDNIGTLEEYYRDVGVYDNLEKIDCKLEIEEGTGYDPAYDSKLDFEVMTAVEGL